MIWSWLLSGVFESFVICMVSVLTMSASDTFGHPTGMWETGALVFTQIVLVVNYKVSLVLEFTIPYNLRLFAN